MENFKDLRNVVCGEICKETSKQLIDRVYNKIQSCENYKQLSNAIEEYSDCNPVLDAIIFLVYQLSEKE